MFGLVDMNKEWKLELATCAEKIDLDMFGIKHNKCIDDGYPKGNDHRLPQNA